MKYTGLEEVVIESDWGSKKSAETNYSPGIGEAKLSLGRLDYTTGYGFTGCFTKGCQICAGS